MFPKCFTCDSSDGCCNCDYVEGIGCWLYKYEELISA